jgi:hypothetical protein
MTLPYAPNVPKHYNVGVTAMLRTISKSRSTFFYNGTICKVNLSTLTIDFVGQKDKRKFSDLPSLARYLRNDCQALERVTELYLKAYANPCPYAIATKQ